MLESSTHFGNCSAQLGIVRNSTTQDDLNLEMRFFERSSFVDLHKK